MPTFLAEEQKFVPWIAVMKKNIPGMNFSLRTESIYMYLILLLLIYTRYSKGDPSSKYVIENSITTVLWWNLWQWYLNFPGDLSHIFAKFTM